MKSEEERIHEMIVELTDHVIRRYGRDSAPVVTFAVMSVAASLTAASSSLSSDQFAATAGALHASAKRALQLADASVGLDEMLKRAVAGAVEAEKKGGQES